MGRAYSCPGRLGQEPRHIKAFLGRLPTGPKTGIRKEGILSLSNDPEIDPGGAKAVHQIDPNTPLEEPVTQQAEFEMSYSQPAMFARLAGFFGALAALLVATGLYGTLAYRTHRRTAEIGMRMALGAQRAQVIWMIMRESLLISTVGVLVGLPLSFACARHVDSMLYQVSDFDPVSLVLAVCSIALMGSLAAFVPARRAAKVDPMVALRYE